MNFSKLCFLDLETTGLESDIDSIVECSFVVTDLDLNELDRFDTVLTPERTPITPFVTQLTGITQAEIDESGQRIADVQDEILKKIGDAPIVGHNIDFDINFLESHGVPIRKNKRIDTHELARVVLVGEESYSLEVLSHQYEITHTDAHRAMSDVQACIQMWPILKNKISQLPREAVPAFDDFFNKKTDWLAGDLFDAWCGTEDAGGFSEKSENDTAPDPLPTLDAAEVAAVTEGHTSFVRAGDSHTGAGWLRAMAASDDRPTLIVTPKIDFFPGLPTLPTPGVLFDAVRHQQWADARPKLSDRETTFWLQCAVRGWLGLGFVGEFDLYRHQREWWKDCCVSGIDDPKFQKMLTDRATEKTLVCSPAAWCELADTEIVSSRWLLVDEAELLAEKMLHAPTTTHSLRQWLDSDDEKKSTTAQFFTAGFVREILEKRLGRAISTFPERELLHPGDRLVEYAAQLREIDGSLAEAADWLENPVDRQVRWVEYFPGDGVLNFSAWQPGEWRNLQKKFAAQPAVLLLRHEPSESNAFCRVFLGREEGANVAVKSLKNPVQIEVPSGLVSSKSPEFPRFCFSKIKEITEADATDDHWMAVQFSSLATIKNIYALLADTPPEGCSVLGEKMSGGDNKLQQQLRQQSRSVLLVQRLQSAAIGQHPFRTLILQKFPFAPPHPLLKFFENEWKGEGLGQSFWDIWTVQTVAARLARQAAQFSKLERVVVLDPAENSRWGKAMLQHAFPWRK